MNNNDQKIQSVASHPAKTSGIKTNPAIKSMPATTRSVAKQLGIWAETEAATILSSAGYKILQRNYHSRYGEIDLIAAQDQTLIFVEVKARKQTQHGGASEVITWSKQHKIFKTALNFIGEYQDFVQYYYRFDVICFDFTEEIAKNLQQDFSKLAYDQQWIENAFTLDADLINL